MTESEIIAIKGVQNGLVVSVSPTEEWKIVTTQLAEHIDKKISFFQGAEITVDVGDRPVPKYELTSLKALLERRGLTLSVISSESDTTKDSARALGLRIASEEVEVTHPPAIEDEPIPETLESFLDEDLLQDTDQIYTEIPDELDSHLPTITDTPFDDTIPFSSEESGTPGVLIHHTLRSGRTAHSNGHLVVYGDVNPGAKIIAAGDIIVWGKLRGMAHAGANGDASAIICALDLNPTQLRIAGHIVTPPSDDKRQQIYPEVAYIREDGIVVESWDEAKG